MPIALMGQSAPSATFQNDSEFGSVAQRNRWSRWASGTSGLIDEEKRRRDLRYVTMKNSLVERTERAKWRVAKSLAFCDGEYD